MKRSRIITLSVCVVGGVLFLGAGFVLYRAVVRFNEARDALTDAEQDLNRFYTAPVFPSASNVKQEQANTEQANAWFAALINRLSEGNITSRERSPSRFIGVLESVSRNLVKEARKAGAVLPDPSETFAFGFDRYAGTGTLPEPQDVPRLTEQLVMINQFCKILFAHRIKGLAAIKRDVFEGPLEGETASRRGGNVRSRRRRPISRRTAPATPASAASASVKQAGIIGEGELFAKMHYVLEFRVKEEALFEVLNALAADSMFVVVTSISISKQTPELVPPMVVAPEDAGRAEVTGRFGANRPATTDETPVKVPKLGPGYPVCGIKMENPLDIRLELDVYKFREAVVEAGD